VRQDLPLELDDVDVPHAQVAGAAADEDPPPVEREAVQLFAQVYG
jgi:hypothetical protein